MSIQLSVLVPGIRSHRWRELYDSIGKSFSGSWEMVVIGPFEPSESLMAEGNVKYIKDFGTPIRCQQIGLLESEGDYITWAADDGQYFPDSLNVSFRILGLDESPTHPHIHEPIQAPRVNKDIPFHHNLVMGKYYEGYKGHVDPNHGAMRHMAEDWYYDLLNHDANKGLKSLEKYENGPPKPVWMLNVGVVPRQLLLEIGGWDCQFEVCPCSYNDLAARLQKYDVEFIIQHEVMYHCGHMPVREGDHGPIHDAQTEHDEPLFRKMYQDPANHTRTIIELDNWKQSADKWQRRFGSKDTEEPKEYSDLPFNKTKSHW
jgi:hypothetical protein